MWSRASATPRPRQAEQRIGYLPRVRRHTRPLGRSAAAGRTTWSREGRPEHRVPRRAARRPPRLPRRRAPAINTRASRGCSGSRRNWWPSGVTPVSLDRAKAREELTRRVNPIGGRGIEPGKGLGPVAGRHQAQQDPGEIHAMDLRLAGLAQAVASVPEPTRASGPEPRGPPGALIGAVGAHPLQHETIDARARRRSAPPSAGRCRSPWTRQAPSTTSRRCSWRR